MPKSGRMKNWMRSWELSSISLPVTKIFLFCYIDHKTLPESFVLFVERETKEVVPDMFDFFLGKDLIEAKQCVPNQDNVKSFEH